MQTRRINSSALTQLLAYFTGTGNKDMSNLTSTLTFANNYVVNDTMTHPGCSSQDNLDSKSTLFDKKLLKTNSEGQFTSLAGELHM